MTPGDVVEILSGDHVGHLGVVLDLHPNGLVGVACGTGTAGRDDTHYVIRARERFGLRMGLPKDTYFYQSRGIATSVSSEPHAICRREVMYDPKRLAGGH